MKHPTLPRFVVIKSHKNGKYLCHVNDDDDDFHGYLQFAGTDFKSSHVKFEIEASSNGLVHLKCCYNNKYWVCHENDRWIRVDANEKEEDQSKWSCTLFKPEFFGPGRFGLYHVYHKRNVTFEDEKPHKLYAGVISELGDYLDYVDWESLPIIPKYIAIKGDNGRYLGATTKDPQSAILDYLTLLSPGAGIVKTLNLILKLYEYFLRFDCTEMGDEKVGNEVFTNPDGTIRIKNIHSGRFWEQNHNWIGPNSKDDTNDNPNTLFSVVMVGPNRIALKNLGNQRYCMRLTPNFGKDDFLSADSSNIIEKAQFEIEELVTRRKIYNVKFHISDARINKAVVVNETAMTSLNNTQVPQKASLNFSYTREESQTWNTSISTKQSISMEITAAVPQYRGTGMKFKQTNEVTTTYAHGNGTSVSEKVEIIQPVDVPAMSKIKGNLLVTKVSCDIPYSYSQRDTLINGEVHIVNMDDGIYTKIHTEIEINYDEVSMRRNAETIPVLLL